MFQDKCRVCLKIQASDNRQLIVADSKEHSDTIGFFAFNFQQIAVCLLLLEGQQHHIVGIEMHIWHSGYTIDVQRITPDGVLTGIQCCRRLIGLVRKGNLLTLLRKHIVAIGIL